MIQAFLGGIIGYVINAIQTILSPIDNLIVNNLPDVASALGTIGNLIDYITDYIGYAVDMSGLSPASILLIVWYWSFALTVPLVVWVIKVLVKWWHALVP